MLTLLLFTAALSDKPLAGAVIVVDPGHGGQTYSRSYTGGTVGVNSKLTESELNLRVGLELAKILKDEGATVHITRTADHRLSRTGSPAKDELHARVEAFEHHACHFFISVHHNAGPETATGHTAIYKHDAKDDALYEAIAREVNDALSNTVPGPKRRLIKESYHLTRETTIPGTISEAGFLTNAAYDKLANEAGYPKKEATAIANGAMQYWRTHKDALKIQQSAFLEARKARPVDPKTYTNISLNPALQKEMKNLTDKLAPGGSYDAAKVPEYLAAYQKTLPAKAFEVKASVDGKNIKLTGPCSDRKYHDTFIDALVAMKLYEINNDIVLPKAKP